MDGVTAYPGLAWRKLDELRSMVLVTALVAAPSMADPHPLYELPTADLPDLHDGSLEDWREVLPEPSLTQDDFIAHETIGDREGAPADPEDLAFSVYLAWHSRTRKLYAAFEIVDDVYVNEYDGEDPANMWKYDSVEFMVDGDHSGGAYRRIEHDDPIAMEMSTAQQYFAIAASPRGRLLEFAFGPFGPEPLYVSPPYADAGGRVDRGSPATSTMELAVTPFDELNAMDPRAERRSLLAQDRVIGFEISVPDFDSEPGVYHAFYNLSGQSNTWRDADLFVDGLLIGCDRGDCGAAPDAITAVEATSWARIKAGLRIGQ